MEVRIHFTHGLLTTNQVDLFIWRLQNPLWFNCSHNKESLCTKSGHNLMCLAAGICFSYSFVKRGICIPKQVVIVWKSNSLHAWKAQSATHTLGLLPVQGGHALNARSRSRGRTKLVIWNQNAPVGYDRGKHFPSKISSKHYSVLQV